jgi:hypothetical protein
MLSPQVPFDISTPMKGNTGKAARKRWTQQLIVTGGVCLCVSAILFVRSLGQKDTDARPQQLRESAQDIFKNKIQDRARKFHEGLHESYTKHQFHEAEMLEKILEAEINLVDLEVVEEELLRAHPSSYAGVYGYFCELNFDVHKKDPAAGRLCYVILSA